jgi:transposase
VPESLRPSLEEACSEIRDLEAKIRSTRRQIKALASQIPAASHLQTVPGIGLLTATALVAFVGDAGRFPSGRHLASFIGLTPREYSSGHVRRLGRISKRGDAYLRTLLIHGARSVLWAAKKQKDPDRLRQWALHLEETRGHNKAAVALANKIARFAWVVLNERRDFQTTRRAA